ncbi:MAG: hypothetical protein OH354_01640 [Candidatus Parvarchaeota archaeon]|nr:hypothetical protein [Candidatus Jingweiarchaeum tengchongense]MCW1300101.1 hypothetical protein [Candidatus Jingweiarchaeum tengchongense]MCW1304455.1 hypothetical protein [Candidatus Jingweiarchaeum tengchongense]MCW1305622.1 hypothetical protein [Candidatus Jingweiarchaeum tengchongense]MCW1309257.1 hypothetical protein [Candidatus Jingweiarchaeum tengchongense]
MRKGIFPFHIEIKRLLLCFVIAFLIIEFIIGLVFLLYFSLWSALMPEISMETRIVTASLDAYAVTFLTAWLYLNVIKK